MAPRRPRALRRPGQRESPCCPISPRPAARPPPPGGAAPRHGRGQVQREGEIGIPILNHRHLGGHAEMSVIENRDAYLSLTLHLSAPVAGGGATRRGGPCCGARRNWTARRFPLTWPS